MQLSTKDFIRAVLVKESLNSTEIRAALLPLYEQHTTSMTNMLVVTMMLITESKCKTLDTCLDYITQNFGKVVSVVEEYGVKLPEEEVQLEQIVKEISEEGEAPVGGGEAPTNVTAGIDPTTPRIYRKRHKDDEDVTATPIITR